MQLPFDYDGTCTKPDFLQVPNYGETLNNVYSGIRIPPSHQLDTNLSKNFGVVEGVNLQVRLDAFNVLNHPLWSESPDSNTNDSTFGVIEKGPAVKATCPANCSCPPR